MTTRLFAYIGTAAAVLVLAKRYADRPGALKLPGGPLIPVLALLLCLALFASASWQNIAAALVAFAIGAVIYTLPRGCQHRVTGRIGRAGWIDLAITSLDRAINHRAGMIGFRPPRSPP